MAGAREGPECEEVGGGDEVEAGLETGETADLGEEVVRREFGSSEEEGAGVDSEGEDGELFDE